jgi:serine/threonine-protein kinase
MRCLEKNPLHRFQSMSDVRVMLMEVASAMSSGLSLNPQKIAAAPRRFSTKLLPMAAAVLVAAAAGAFGYWFFFSGQSKSAPAHYDISLPRGTTSTLTHARLSPDGRSIVYVGENDDGKILLRRSLDGYESEPIKGSEGSGYPVFSPDGKWIGFEWGSNEIRKIPAEGGTPITVCKNCKPVNGVEWGAANDMLFATREGITKVSADGGEARLVTKLDQTKTERSHYEPRFLPNGRDFVFSVLAKSNRKPAVYSARDKKWTYIGNVGDGTYSVYVAGHLVFTRENYVYAVPFNTETLTASGTPEIVSEGIFPFFPRLSFSNSGSALYMPEMRNIDSELVWIERGGGETPVFKKKRNYTAPRLSPSGDEIAVVVDSDLWVYNIESGRGIRLTDDGGVNYPVWKPDGNQVVYAVENNGRYSVNIKNSDGSGGARKIVSGDKAIRPYSYHPTENLILGVYFPATADGDIVTVDVDDGTMNVLIDNEATNDMPAFSPDGKWYAYFTTESGKTQIFVLPWGRDGARTLVTEGSGLFPTWSGDSKELFFANTRIMRSVTLFEGGELKIGQEKDVFSGNFRSMFDISKDGKRALVVKTSGGVFPNYVRLVTNWTSKLEK